MSPTNAHEDNNTVRNTPPLSREAEEEQHALATMPDPLYVQDHLEKEIRGAAARGMIVSDTKAADLLEIPAVPVHEDPKVYLMTVCVLQVWSKVWGGMEVRNACKATGWAPRYYYQANANPKVHEALSKHMRETWQIIRLGFSHGVMEALPNLIATAKQTDNKTAAVAAAKLLVSEARKLEELAGTVQGDPTQPEETRSRALETQKAIWRLEEKMHEKRKLRLTRVTETVEVQP